MTLDVRLVPVELDAMVAAALGERRPEFAELVRRAVDVELNRLVDELVQVELAARANGSGPAAAIPPPRTSCRR